MLGGHAAANRSVMSNAGAARPFATSASSFSPAQSSKGNDTMGRDTSVNRLLGTLNQQGGGGGQSGSKVS